MIFALDDNGLKIQRYDQAYRIDTDDGNDELAARKALRETESTYRLTAGDCSDVPRVFLNSAKKPKGEKLKNGEGWGRNFNTLNEIPNMQQEKIEERNPGQQYDLEIRPTIFKLQEGELGKKEG